jgi:RNA polymerase sigma-70 factor (ECF subfamily)
MPSDAANVPHAAGGEAIAQLYGRFAKELFGFCLFKLGTVDEAEEAVQNTFVKALDALNCGASPDREAAWLYTIALNVCRTQYRTRARRADREVLAASREFGDTPAAEPPDVETTLLLPALETLTARARQALLTREWQGLSYREIAEELKLSESAVETLLFRARKAVARAIQAGAQGGANARGQLVLGLPWLSELTSAFDGADEVKVAACTAATGLVTLAARRVQETGRSRVL